MEKRKLILRNHLCPGDLIMLTAAVRDLHESFPGRFLTDVRSSCPELWEHNPYITPLRETARGVEQIECHYPLIDRSNEAPYHCIHGFAEFLGGRLNLPIRPTVFRGDIHLSAEEQRWKSAVHELAGRDLPFWIINAGGKFDFTIKWWDWKRYQQVVDHFRGRILFVQVGEIGHHHPPLRHAIDLRGKTDLRQLVRLVYHAQGVLCGVTALMHLAAAVPTRPDRPPARAAVIVAGGREPTHWEAYPHHQFIHTIGALSCCATGGCWRARTRALGDGQKEDRAENLCLNVVAGDLPRCMDMITADEVIRRVETYFAGRALHYLMVRERRAAMRAVARSLEGPRFDTTTNLATAPAQLHRAARWARRAPVPVMGGQGILLFVNTVEELTPALACVRIIRALGSDLPVECWVNTPRTPRVVRAFREANATIRHVASGTAPNLPSTTFAGLRLHALTRTPWREVLIIDAGNFPLIAPDALFAHRRFRAEGALFMREGPCRARPGVWALSGLDRPARAAGLAITLLDRQCCWAALQVWQWIADRFYFFAGYVDGDGGAAQLAFAKSRQPAPMSSRMARDFWSCGRNKRMPSLLQYELRRARRDLAGLT